MEKRVILAIVLCILVLLGYNFLVSKVYHLEKPVVVPPPEKPAEIKVIPQASFPMSLEHKVLENEDLRVSFSNLGARIEEIYLKKFNQKFFESEIFTLAGLENTAFALKENQNNRLTYIYEDNQKRINKIYRITNNGIELEVLIQNVASTSKNFDLKLNYFSLDLLQKNPDFQKNKNYLDLIISLPDNILRKNILKINSKDSAVIQSQFNWLGLKDRYFCTIFKPEKSQGYYLKLSDNKRLTVGEQINLPELTAKNYQSIKVSLFAGPLNLELLTATDKSFGQIVNFGAFDPISKGLLSFLRFVHRFLPNWGASLIILSCALFFLLYPLTLKSLKSMKAMQELQPEMERLRKENKDNPQKLNKEIMELYRRNKINPLGGCLPMLLQIPIFFALYQALIRSLELKGAKFLWIKDLSEPDRLFTLPSSLPILGNELNILPILMAIVMFLQQKITGKTTASVNPEQQKMMMVLFPVLFGFMFYHLSSGLVLYWFVYSGLSLVFQWKQVR